MIDIDKECPSCAANMVFLYAIVPDCTGFYLCRRCGSVTCTYYRRGVEKERHYIPANAEEHP